VSWAEELRKSGRAVQGEKLRAGEGRVLRGQGGKMAVTDGPFAETKEQLGGFYLINATDLNEAIQVASRIPSSRTGSIEVRPIWVFNAQ
jgi:hypothetical protein